MTTGDDGGRLAHDLRALLAVIVGYSELLKIRDDAETRREAAEQIAEAARRISALVDTLDDVSS